jgi:hypothetical protein
MRELRIFFFLVAASVTCLAQDRGTITGRVTDPSAAVVAGATITVTNLDTGIKISSMTNVTGNYSVAGLAFGKYEVACEIQGFRKYVRKDVSLDVAQTLSLDIPLEVGAVDQTVEVTAAAPLLEKDTSDLGTVVDKKQVEDLPLSIAGNMRNPESFVLLAPGVVGNAADTEINGSQDRAKAVLFDGAISTGPESGGTLFTYPPVESIGEFKLLSNNFSAEYGRTGGGFEIFTSKSGGNQYHGSLWEYLRNDKFDARGFIAQTTPINRQNEFGASFGGPVRIPKLYNGKNKTFFFFVYNGFRYTAGATNNVLNLPTLKQRSGDFSGRTKGGVPLLIYDPQSTGPDASGNLTRTPFANALIPADRISAVSRALIQLLPVPDTTQQTGNYFAVGAQVFNRDVETVKFDHNFTERNRLSIFYYHSSETSTAPESIKGAMSNALAQFRKPNWARVNHDFIFNAATINNFRVGYTREPQQWARVASDHGYLQAIGLKGTNPPGDIIPRVQFTDSYSNWADEVKNKGLQVNNTLQLADTLSHFKGNHAFKFGFDTNWQQTNGADTFNQQGTTIFSGNETAFPSASGRATSGDPLASFLVGALDSANYNGLFVVPAMRYHYFAAFFADDWKVSRRLTINYGLRWDLFIPRQDSHNNMSGFDPTLANPGADGHPGGIAFLGSGAGRDGRNSFADTDYKNFGPRLGFAFQLFKNTVLRGGYGIYYGQGNATAGLRQSQTFSYGFNAAPSWASTDAGVTPAFYWDNGFPTNWPRPPFIDPTVQNGTSIAYIARADGRPPYFGNYQFSVQQMLASRLVLDVAYVGVKGTRLGNNLISLNQLNPSYLALGSLLTQNITSTAAKNAGIVAPYAGFTGSVAQALRPYPQFQNITELSNPNGNSSYNALQVKLIKRLSQGMTILGSYTFSKNMTDGNIAAGGGPAGEDYYNRRLEKSLSTFDVPHNFAVAYTYELPFGRGKMLLNNGSVPAKILGGWQLTGIQQYQTGQPVQLTASNTLPIFNGTLRPNLNLGVPMTLNPVNPLTDPWFNKAAFSVPTTNTLGNAARSYTQLRAPNLYNENFGLMRRIRIREAATITLRGEFFNALNRVVFAAPASNISSSTFGRVTAQSNNPRQGQVSMRLDF